MQSAFERAGISLRRAGADVNVTAEVDQTGESTQQSFGTTLNVRSYSVELEAESPRWENEIIGMPNTPPVSADPRVGTERLAEYARKLAPEVAERVRAYLAKRQ
jgi:hypothetical protein